jgi:hypothetical protein
LYGLVSLVIIAAFLAEFLTGSNSIPQVIAYPPSLLFNVALYGSGALLIREASVRWRKRWATVLLLGGAYAVGEEGFAAKVPISTRRVASARAANIVQHSQIPRVGSPGLR